MGKAENLDFTGLLGFYALGDVVTDRFDFRNETVAARLGAKVGEPDDRPASKLAGENSSSPSCTSD